MEKDEKCGTLCRAVCSCEVERNFNEMKASVEKKFKELQRRIEELEGVHRKIKIDEILQPMRDLWKKIEGKK